MTKELHILQLEDRATDGPVTTSAAPGAPDATNHVAMQICYCVADLLDI